METEIGFIDMVIYGVGAFFVLSTIVVALMRYRIANSNQILVVTGKVGGNKSAKTIHGGATFIWPLIQKYFYLDLTPMQVKIDLQNALSLKNIRINVPASFTIAIGTEASIMGAAAERLLGKTQREISAMAEEIIFGQLRSTIATMDIESINADRDKFIANVFSSVEIELKKVGLIVVNVNITDITDESGYLEALGKKAAADVIERAKVDVAEKERDGRVGEAEAKREERIKVADANSKAVAGENLAEQDISVSNADLIVKQQEQKKKETSSTLVNKAEAEKEGYDANKIAEDARALQEESKLKADVIVPANIEKDKVAIEAEAEKIKEVKAGEAKGDAIKAELEGQADGLKAILEAKADGFKSIVQAAGSPEAAAQLMIIEQLPELTRIQVDAIKNIKIDKITVWDTGSGGGKNGNSTSDFMQSMMKALPPMNELLNQSGLNVPEWMAKSLAEGEMPTLPAETIDEETDTETPDSINDDVEETETTQTELLK